MINFSHLEIQYRQFKEQDLVHIAEIEKMCFAEPWSLKALQDFVKHPTNHILVANHCNKRIAGYITYSTVLDEVQIANIAVHEDYRRRKIGQDLLKTLYSNAIISGMKVITLEVRESNAPAIALYEKCKYATVGRRKHFYSDPKEDAILMNLNL